MLRSTGASAISCITSDRCSSASCSADTDRLSIATSSNSTAASNPPTTRTAPADSRRAATHTTAPHPAALTDAAIRAPAPDPRDSRTPPPCEPHASAISRSRREPPVWRRHRARPQNVSPLRLGARQPPPTRYMLNRLRRPVRRASSGSMKSAGRHPSAGGFVSGAFGPYLSSPASIRSTSDRRTNRLRFPGRIARNVPSATHDRIVAGLIRNSSAISASVSHGSSGVSGSLSGTQPQIRSSVISHRVSRARQAPAAQPAAGCHASSLKA